MATCKCIDIYNYEFDKKDYKEKIEINDRIILITNGQNKTMPNMTNWSKREANYVLDYFGIKYTLNGNVFIL